MCSIPAWGRSPGEGNGNSFQYSCLGNPMDRGAWWTTVHGVGKRHDWGTEHTCTSLCPCACVRTHTHTHTDGHMPSRLLGSPLQLYPLFLPFAFSASALEIFELAISAAESEKELLGKFLLALRLQMMFVLWPTTVFAKVGTTSYSSRLDCGVVSNLISPCLCLSLSPSLYTYTHTHIFTSFWCREKYPTSSWGSPCLKRVFEVTVSHNLMLYLSLTNGEYFLLSPAMC